MIVIQTNINLRFMETYSVSSNSYEYDIKKNNKNKNFTQCFALNLSPINQSFGSQPNRWPFLYER